MIEPSLAADAPRDEIERRLRQTEDELAQLSKISGGQELDLKDQIARLRARVDALRAALWRDPTPWQIVQVARHAERPKLPDYLSALFSDVVELRGDRLFADDRAIFCGLARFDGRAVAVIGHNKGKDTRENLERRWGMPNPDGYRKAIRVARLAEKIGVPVVALVDTPAAYPGIEAEQRGQAEAIARSILVMSQLRAPIVVAITGEGGSGGALAIAVGDRLLMMQYAIYSVIPPEGCAAILWRDAARKEEAAAALRLTAPDLLAAGIVDEIVPEPTGGAHLDAPTAIAALRDALRRALDAVREEEVPALLSERYAKFRRIGPFAG
ncbi:MAG: acetyl-CoA carboxylase carboxyltransferase subunit alpha [Armatimonadetes bacterium]|nr:acetyl-CoA carboxylase carboxyltransferase subunit alpha [Armatimonadota bacterium]